MTGCCGPKGSFGDGYCSFGEREGVRVSSEAAIGIGEVVQAPRGFGVVGSEGGFAEGDSSHMGLTCRLACGAGSVAGIIAGL
jgi:hypothetical protein